MNGSKTILLAEDDGNDVFLMQRTLQRINEPISLQTVKTAEETIDYLSGKNKFADRTLHPLPSLILLDIKMPGQSGFDVLKWLKRDGTLTHIPAVMVTSSKAKRDIDRARDSGASGYLVKPVELQELKHLLAAIQKVTTT
ncbi:MAG: response regulator [Verrucomicrobiales bacterium]|nr:response regulator [Verrucomicrobiales bacterium]